MDLRCYESMEPLQQNENCPDVENHEARLRRAEDLCRARADGRAAAQRGLEEHFRQALDARRLQVDAERNYTDLVRQRDLVNSMVEGMSGGRVRRTDFRRVEHLVNDARRTMDTANRRIDNAEERVCDAQASVSACDSSHTRNCDFCCFRVYCTGCGIQLR